MIDRPPVRVGGLGAGLLAADVAAWLSAAAALHGEPALLATALLAYGFGLHHALETLAPVGDKLGLHGGVRISPLRRPHTSTCWASSSSGAGDELARLIVTWRRPRCGDPAPAAV